MNDARGVGCTGEQDLGARDSGGASDGATPGFWLDSSRADDGATAAQLPDADPSVTATDPSGISKVTIDQGGGNFATFTTAPYSGSLSVTAADSGVYEFTAPTAPRRLRVHAALSLRGVAAPRAGRRAGATHADQSKIDRGRAAPTDAERLLTRPRPDVHFIARP